MCTVAGLTASAPGFCSSLTDVRAKIGNTIAIDRRRLGPGTVLLAINGEAIKSTALTTSPRHLAGPGTGLQAGYPLTWGCSGSFTCDEVKTADLIFPFQKASYCAYISEEEHPETSLRRLAIGKLKGIIMMTTRDMQPRWTMQVWLPDVSLKAVKARQVAQVEWVVGSPLPADGSCWGSRVWTWAEREQQTYKTRNHPCVQCGKKKISTSLK